MSYYITTDTKLEGVQWCGFITKVGEKEGQTLLFVSSALFEIINKISDVRSIQNIINKIIWVNTYQSNPVYGESTIEINKPTINISQYGLVKLSSATYVITSEYLE
jgi:hypothetical protein